ncbi:MAG: DUF998 domain-containing protein [Candidatus Helarchaeota archaeon]
MVFSNFSGEIFNSEKKGTFNIKFAILPTIISFFLSLTLSMIAVQIYPNFNWVYNSFSHLGLYPKGAQSIYFFSGALIITFLGNIPLLICCIKQSIQNIDKLKFIGLIFLFITDSTFGFEALFPMIFYNLHLFGAQLLLISLIISLLILIISNFKRKIEKNYKIIYLASLILLLIIWPYYLYLNYLNPLVNYAIPELIDYTIFYVILATLFNYLIINKSK